MEMLLTGSQRTAKEALRIGMVDTIADDVLTSALNYPPHSV